MNRGNRYVLISHCLLNVNSKVKGYALYVGVLKELVVPLIQEGIGLFQLPCPETTFAGNLRWGMTVEQYNIPSYRRHSRLLLQPVLDQVQDDIKNGVSVLGVIGVDGSPSCGIDLTCYGYTGGQIGSNGAVEESRKNVRIDSGQGIFMEELTKMLEKQNINIPFVAVNEDQPEKTTWMEIRKKINL
jgi:predicted secreted protein